MIISFPRSSPKTYLSILFQKLSTSVQKPVRPFWVSPGHLPGRWVASSTAWGTWTKSWIRSMKFHLHNSTPAECNFPHSYWAGKTAATLLHQGTWIKSSSSIQTPRFCPSCSTKVWAKCRHVKVVGLQRNGFTEWQCFISYFPWSAQISFLEYFSESVLIHVTSCWAFWNLGFLSWTWSFSAEPQTAFFWIDIPEPPSIFKHQLISW